ncbi:MAG TPA: phenylacetate-CoA oxygenase subunit PaaJ [Saprospiraceae bacterium]|nr:phenylacetate-CoA oxygenase subunit PaaJ [Saprospiraceae bacterium]HMP24971.1 phenylacetate-CoA oxygenase subunit PaaJ [Saprospiraceae bacterium]
MTTTSATETIWAILEEVTDPEIPVLTVVDLGVIRDVIMHDDESVEVIITPTYSGCPAMNTIEINIKATLQEKGFDLVKVTTVLSPAWTTDWLSEAGKEKLRAYGIAPPVGSVSKRALFGAEPVVACPLCSSEHTEMISQFGSTACKSLYRCKDCLEPFDYFKCH